MKYNTRTTSPMSGIRSALLGLALLTAGMPAFAGNGNLGNPNIMPPQSHSNGLSYAEWAERFWQWAHALADANGDPTAPQSGPVWFLASAPFNVPGKPPVLRNIT